MPASSRSPLPAPDATRGAAGGIDAAVAFRVRVRAFSAESAQALDNAFAAIATDLPHALTMLSDVIFAAKQGEVAAFATRTRLPAIYNKSRFAEAGGLMSYAPRFEEFFREAATYVNKILRGRQARRPSGRAAAKVRAGHQSESSQGPRLDDSANTAASRRRGPSVAESRAQDLVRACRRGRAAAPARRCAPRASGVLGGVARRVGGGDDARDVAVLTVGECFGE